MELNLVIQLAILTGIISVISGVVILYARRWYLYWRQVFLISAMEKQRSGGDNSAQEEEQPLARSGAADLFAYFALCYALILLTYKAVLNAAAFFFSLVYTMSLRVFMPGT